MRECVYIEGENISARSGGVNASHMSEIKRAIRSRHKIDRYLRVRSEIHAHLRVYAGPVIKPVIAPRHSGERNRQAYLSLYINHLETTFLSPVFAQASARTSFFSLSFFFFTPSALIMLMSPAGALTCAFSWIMLRESKKMHVSLFEFQTTVDSRGCLINADSCKNFIARNCSERYGSRVTNLRLITRQFFSSKNEADGIPQNEGNTLYI